MKKNVNLKIDWVDTGFCIVVYKTQNDLGQTIKYGLQDEGDNFGGIRLMRCTYDGEPMYEVKKIKPEYEFNFEMATGNSKLENLVNEFIQKRSWEQKENINET